MTYHPTKAAALRSHHLAQAQAEIRACNACFAAADALAYGRPGRPYAVVPLHSQARDRHSLSMIDDAVLDGLDHAERALRHAARAQALTRAAHRPARRPQGRTLRASMPMDIDELPARVSNRIGRRYRVSVYDLSYKGARFKHA